MVVYRYYHGCGFTDTDLVSYNFRREFKDTLQEMPDVDYANEIAEELIKTLGLEISVCHQFMDPSLERDYLFAGQSWLDPGEIVEIPEILGPPDFDVL